MSDQAQTGEYVVQPARTDDIDNIIHSIEQLLEELSGKTGIQLYQNSYEWCRRVIEDPSLGAIIVCRQKRSAKSLVGVITLSISNAIRVPKPYAVIEELWVDPAYRSVGVGASLLDEAMKFAEKSVLSRLEVGLPPFGFPNYTATEQFYGRNGFSPVGARMKRIL
ncbi:GNAT family N-acetyltransferase [Saccharospirillum salsuginis]|uniref:N-acetyltransferase domain-containing protein n=1 Tax=Saccharospirillum salsuginis TaxID=418750 RepID=A0A918KB35_9GAMM|nr:GNAT family N-acetyltransferase [Saccharospirillum salsuginis]GGX57499.1 hypothetical protein GCM10007392_26340 [Saccharospirillum salsuginis]